MYYFEPTYKTIENVEESNIMYQTEYLKAFQIEEFDFSVIDKEMKDLYKSVEHCPVVREYLEKHKKMYPVHNLEFILFQMFSYHHFHEFYPILKNSYDFSNK